jgi:hypothetical protein
MFPSPTRMFLTKGVGVHRHALQLGVPIELVDVVHGDTGKIPFGMGTYASRSLAVGGSAIVRRFNRVSPPLHPCRPVYWALSQSRSPRRLTDFNR